MFPSSKFNAQFDLRTIGIPLGGGNMLFYYRADLFEKYRLLPPKTWSEYVQLAALLKKRSQQQQQQQDKKTLVRRRTEGNNDRISNSKKRVFGSCVYASDEFFYAVAATILQTKGPQQGLFFDVDDMRPLIKNAGFKF